MEVGGVIKYTTLRPIKGRIRPVVPRVLANEARALAIQSAPRNQGLSETRGAQWVVSRMDNQGQFGEDGVEDYSFIKLEGDICGGCRNPIADRYLLQVQGGQAWHTDCLRCAACAASMENMASCFVKEEALYCKPCYQRQFGIKCARCNRTIQATDWVRKARQNVYHLACFACDTCKRQLSSGEEFALQESRVLCKTHYMELLDGDSHKSNQKQKTKRVRTTFTEEQLQVLQANFQIDSNPDGQDLERIAQITGLSKRVTQVWFQNSRARQKKYQGQKSKSNPSDDSCDEDCLKEMPLFPEDDSMSRLNSASSSPIEPSLISPTNVHFEL